MIAVFFSDLFHCLKPNYAAKSQSKITPEQLKDDIFASTTSRTTITSFFFFTFLTPLKLYNFLNETMKGLFKTISKSHKSDKKINNFKKKQKSKSVVLMQIQVCVHVCWTFPLFGLVSSCQPPIFSSCFYGTRPKKVHLKHLNFTVMTTP